MRQRARRTLAFGLTLFGGLVLLEGGLHFATWAQVWQVYPRNLDLVRKPERGMLFGVEGEARFVTNSLGLRADAPKADAEPTVLCLGGGTTACEFLDQSEAWPALVQTRLRAAGWPRAMVSNAGRAGRDSRDHVAQAQRLTPALAPDWVVLLAGVGDLSRAVMQGSRLDPGFWHGVDVQAELESHAFFSKPVEPSWWPLDRTVIWNLIDRARRKRWVTGGAGEDASGSSYAERRARRAAAQDWSPMPNLADGLAEFVANLDRIADAVENAGSRLLLVEQATAWGPDLPAEVAERLWFGWLEQPPSRRPSGYVSAHDLANGMDSYNAALAMFAEDRGLPLVRLADEAQHDWFYDDCHLNEAGARAVAERVATALAAELASLND